MSTRSIIAAYDAGAASFASIYCHFDGYPEGVGAMLTAHYTDEAKIRELLALGDISTLNPEIGEPHDFDWHMTLHRQHQGLAWDEVRKLVEARPENNWCNVYGRDRGESDVEAAATKG